MEKRHLIFSNFKFFIIILLLVKNTSNAQSIVSNPYLKYSYDTVNYNDINVWIDGWYTDKKISLYPHYFETLSSGDGVAKFMLIHCYTPDLHQYIQVSLAQTLQKGVIYTIDIETRWNVIMGAYGENIPPTFNIDRLAKEKVFGVSFSESVKEHKEIIKMTPKKSFDYHNTYNLLKQKMLLKNWAKEYGGKYDTKPELWQSEWFHITFDYKAEGYENNLILGNFDKLSEVGKKYLTHNEYKETISLKAYVKSVTIEPKNDKPRFSNYSD